jgi:hypothetical protein
VRSRTREKWPQSKKIKINIVVNNKNIKMDYDEPHLVLNEKMQPIQGIERPTSALVAADSL